MWAVVAIVIVAGGGAVGTEDDGKPADNVPCTATFKGGC